MRLGCNRLGLVRVREEMKMKDAQPDGRLLYLPWRVAMFVLSLFITSSIESENNSLVNRLSFGISGMTINASSVLGMGRNDGVLMSTNANESSLKAQDARMLCAFR